MQSKQNKILLGVLALILFISILIVAGDGMSKLAQLIPDFENPVLDRFFSLDRGPRSQQGLRNLITQEVVQEESSVIDVVDAVSPSVVSIVVETVSFDPFTGPSSDEQGIGTGFIVDSSGLIVTNSHVVDSEEGQYSVVLKDGTTYPVTRINLDQISDLAIIEIEGRDLPTVDLGDSDAVRVGQRAIAIGNALGRFSNTVTVGVVSGVARELVATGAFGSDPKTYEGVIQTDAALNPGNSGGPLLNSAGQVIGVNVATTSGADNIGFAIPVNTLKPLLQSFLEEGRIIRPYIGVSYSIITDEVAEIRDFPTGAYVSAIIPNSPASKAGIRRGDIITAFDGDQISEENTLSSFLSSKKVGDRVSLTIDRNREQRDVDLVLEEAPDRF
jgi:S1-C subfamily serine protease